MEDWIRVGGTREDAGTLGGNVTGRNRYFRHFHDPLLPWDRSGLFYLLTLPPRLTRFESSVHWAQLENQDSISGFGSFSWRDARRYFRTALTDPAPAIREQAFADTFRTLGQVMHLIVDASVPEHVRNDIHPMGEFLDKLGLVGNYEYWVLAQHRHSGTLPGFIRDFLSTPMDLDEDVLRIPIPDSESVAQAPIARLFDSDRYTGDNPEVTAESRIGIAEIANANFFSEDSHRGEYPHPALANLETFTRIYSQNGQERTYYRKLGAGLGVAPIAVECTLAEPTGVISLCPDEDVWRETARHMLPRAVRYSREVLDYFFRGTLDFTIGGSSPNQTLTITNKSNEAMDGTFTLYADNFSDTRSRVASFDLNLAQGATSAPLSFTFTPAAQVKTYILVFQGRLGNEQGAVAAKVTEVEDFELLFSGTVGGFQGVYVANASGIFFVDTRDEPGFSPFPDIRYLFWGENPNTFGFVAHGSGSGGFLDVFVYRIDRDKTSTASPLAGQTDDGRPILKATRILRTAIFPNLNLGTHSYNVQYHTHRSAHVTIIRIADFLEGDRSWACQEVSRETTRLDDVVHETKTRSVQINPGIGQLDGFNLELTNASERISYQFVSAWIDSNEKLHALYRTKYLIGIQTTIAVPFAQAFASHPTGPPLFTNRLGGISIDDPVNTPVPWPVPFLSISVHNQTISPLGFQAPTFDEWNDIVLLNLTDGTIEYKTFDDVVRFSWEEDFHMYFTSPVVHVWGWSKGPAQLEPSDQWNFTPYDFSAGRLPGSTLPVMQTPIQVTLRDFTGQPVVAASRSRAYNIQSAGRLSGFFPNPPAIQQSTLQEDLPYIHPLVVGGGDGLGSSDACRAKYRDPDGTGFALTLPQTTAVNFTSYKNVMNPGEHAIRRTTNRIKNGNSLSLLAVKGVPVGGDHDFRLLSFDIESKQISELIDVPTGVFSGASSNYGANNSGALLLDLVTGEVFFVQQNRIVEVQAAGGLRPINPTDFFNLFDGGRYGITIADGGGTLTKKRPPDKNLLQDVQVSASVESVSHLIRP